MGKGEVRNAKEPVSSSRVEKRKKRRKVICPGKRLAHDISNP
jgi:hypothetical protein